MSEDQPPRKKKKLSEAVLAGIDAGHINISAQSDESYVLSEEAVREQVRYQKLHQQLEAKRLQSQIAVPTNDYQVKMRLRQFGQPICKFGEQAPERRDRLRGYLANLKAAGKSISKPEPEPEPIAPQEEETYYGKGVPELKTSRIRILKFSMQRASSRIVKQKEKRDNPDKFWKVKSNALMKSLGNFTGVSSEIGDDRCLSSCSFSSNSKMLAIGSWSGKAKLWSLDGKVVRVFKGHKDRISDILFHPEACASLSPDVMNFVTGGVDRTIKFWSLNSSKALATLTGHKSRISRLAFHPISRYLVSSSYDKCWGLWDLQTQRLLLKQEGHSSPIYAIAIHPDGGLCLTGDLGGICRIWDLRSGKATMALPGHVRQILAADFNIDGYHAATGSEDNTIKIWDLRRKEVFYSIAAHTKNISTVKYEKDGEFLISSSFDKTCKVWSARDYKLAKQLTGHEDKIMQCDITRDNTSIATVSYDRTWKLWTQQDKIKEEKVKMEI